MSSFMDPHEIGVRRHSPCEKNLAIEMNRFQIAHEHGKDGRKAHRENHHLGGRKPTRLSSDAKVQQGA